MVCGHAYSSGKSPLVRGVCDFDLFSSTNLLIFLLDAGFAGIVYLVMLLLLSQQMSESRSPAALSRISRWSFIAQALTDSIAFACVGLNI